MRLPSFARSPPVHVFEYTQLILILEEQAVAVLTRFRRRLILFEDDVCIE